MHKSIRNTPDTIIGGSDAKCYDCFEWPKVEVMKTRGYYVGTVCACGPYSRETEYFKTREEAWAVLSEVSELVFDLADYGYCAHEAEQISIEDAVDRTNFTGRQMSDFELDAMEERERLAEERSK